MMRGPLLVVFGLLCWASSALCAVVVSTSPSVLASSLSPITLSWSGIVNASASDFLSVYTPSTSDPEAEIGWFPLNTAPDWITGSGQITFNLVNPHTDYVFRIWTVNASYVQTSLKGAGRNHTGFSPVSISDVVTFQNPYEPVQGHLALTGTQGEMRVMWVSGSSSPPFIPTVQYGLTEGTLDLTATGVYATYDITMMCTAPANQSDFFRDPGLISDVLLAKLLPSTRYFYRFGSNQTGWSQVMIFVTPHPVGPNSEVNVVAFGDLGIGMAFESKYEQQTPSLTTINRVGQALSLPAYKSAFSHLSKHADSVGSTPPPWTIMHIGDISYARGLAWIWDWFGGYTQPIASQAPYIVSMGNHEYDYTGQPFRTNWTDYNTDSGGECGIPYYARFHMPDNGDVEAMYPPVKGQPSPRNLYFSYNQGPVHFIITNAETNFTAGSPQYNWIVQDLASVQRSVTPWVVFSGHRPMYSSIYQGTDTFYEHIREALEPVLVKYQVDMCLWGHVHVYERTCQMVNYTCTDGGGASGSYDLEKAHTFHGPVHVTIGMAGNEYSVPWDSPSMHANGDGEWPEPDWSIFRSNVFGYTRFFANGTDLYFEFVANQRNQVHDSFWLHK